MEGSKVEVEVEVEVKGGRGGGGEKWWRQRMRWWR